jgi:hypothetical protein
MSAWHTASILFIQVPETRSVGLKDMVSPLVKDSIQVLIKPHVPV